MRITFSSNSLRDRMAVRTLLDILDNQEIELEEEVVAEEVLAPIDPHLTPDQLDRLRGHLPHLLRLSSGKLLDFAVQNFGPNIPFDMKELAAKVGVDTETMLSKNRTLSYSCRIRGLEKRWLLVERGGYPKKFVIPEVVHRLIVEAGNSDSPPPQEPKE